MSQLRARPWSRGWLAGWSGLVAGELFIVRAFSDQWEQPTLLFWIVVVAAGLCVVASGALIARAWRMGIAESAVLGSFLMAVSALPLAHGLTVPGVVYGPNTATMATVFWAVPVGLVVLVPCALPRSRVAVRILGRWKVWVTSHLAAVGTIVAVALARPNSIPVPAMGSRGAAVGVVVSLSCCVALSYRHLRLAWIARARGPLTISAGVAFVGASTLVFLGSGPWTAGFWIAHGLDIAGVLTATVAAVIVYRRSDSIAAIFDPVLVSSPLRALELGLDPLVRSFVAALDQKDPITRDHVVRTAQMANLLSAEVGLPLPDRTTITLGALLHDVGKLAVPDAVLTKPGRLDAAEYEIVKRHTIEGARLVAESPALAELAPIVRGHHERVDGHGYPDRLIGDAIPLGARIVAVCDAYDAMAHTRQYRAGMGSDRAVSILAEHAGAQWDASLVARLGALVRRRGTHFDGDALADVGRTSKPDRHDWCGCADALPPELVRLAGPTG